MRESEKITSQSTYTSMDSLSHDFWKLCHLTLLLRTLHEKKYHEDFINYQNIIFSIYVHATLFQANFQGKNKQTYTLINIHFLSVITC